MGKVGLARVQRLKSDSGSGKVVDARDEGELGVNASMRREGGRRREKSPRCLRSGRGFYGRWKGFCGRRLGFPVRKPAVFSVPFGVRSWDSCRVSSCRHTPSRDSGSGKVLGHCAQSGHEGAEHSWPAEHLSPPSTLSNSSSACGNCRSERACSRIFESE